MSAIFPGRNGLPPISKSSRMTIPKPEILIAMLDQTDINVGRLLSWLSSFFGLAALLANVVHYIPGLGSVGVALIVIACTLTVRRTLISRDQSMREAFEMGRDHERMNALRPLR